ncbi:MAG: mechanosensitive ion channel family protein [Syntrophotaleaceae bacterium]
MQDLQVSALPEFLRQHLSGDRLLSSLTIIALTAGGLWLLRWALKALSARFTRYRLLISGLYPVLRLLCWVSAAAYILFIVIRPPLNTLLAVSASAGLALGLGAQDLIRNIVAGILILFERPFHIGDMIQVGEHYGEVVNIGLRSVQIRTFEDSMVTFPNALIQTQAVSNANAGQLNEMVIVRFHLPAEIPVGPVKELAWEAAACSPYVHLGKPIAVLIEDRFDYRFLTRFTIKAYVHEIRLERVLASDILERVKQELHKNGFPEPATFNRQPAQTC